MPRNQLLQFLSFIKTVYEKTYLAYILVDRCISYSFINTSFTKLLRLIPQISSIIVITIPSYYLPIQYRKKVYIAVAMRYLETI
jgi:hypothetical protein